MTYRARLSHLVIAIGILCLTSSWAQAAGFKIIDLKSAFDTSASSPASQALSINNSGQITGFTFDRKGADNGFILTPRNGKWFVDDDSNGSNDLFEEIVRPDSVFRIRPQALNDLGAVVGIAHITSGPTRGFLWKDGVFTVLGSLGERANSGGNFSEAWDINNSGDIVGLTAIGELDGGAFLLRGGGMTALPKAPNGSSGTANGINNFGQIVGWQTISGVRRAVVWDGAVVEILEDFGAKNAVGLAINDSGWVSGFMQPQGVVNQVAVVWDSVFTRKIAFHNSGKALDINSHGQAVGSAGSTGFIWVPSPAYGLPFGFHPLTGLLPQNSGWRLTIVSSINDDGVIVGTGFHNNKASAFVIIPPPPPGLIVNTTGDAPDSDPTDGECNTGNVAANGQPECTMRAAIEEANAQAGLDTILFDIPVSGIPVIQVGNRLPEITEQILIDGATQPTADKVEINGSAALSADGLLISGGDSEIRNLLINDFAGNGLVLLTGGNNIIGNLSIGVGPDGVENRRNDGHGIFITNSSGNKIGDAVLSRKNIIAYNNQNGVYVESGTGNTVRGNSIFSNTGLGIDLGIKRVTPNDAGDGDSGANGLQNFPMIDSVQVGLVTTIWGTINTIGGRSYDIDIYVSDSCDASGFGEGKTLIQSAPIFVDADGTTEFEIMAVTTPFRGQYLTATATDRDGNTSEFSLCVSANHVRLVDDNEAPILFNKFAMFTVASDAPAFTETFVDTVLTGEFGIVDLTKYNIPSGKLLRFSRQLSTTLSPKRATTPKSALSVNLDNAMFDSSSSQMSYFETTDDMVQVVKMTHTTVAFNLYVSVEFDATVAYINNLQNAFRLASNYLYDVTDGQARLDTVFITDNRAGWNIADVWIFASNLEWPRASLNGLLTNGQFVRFYMPRKFYGDSTINRNQTALENPLNPATPNSYRTFIHELGHYALGFGDEYVFTSRLGKCSLIDEYGFMENHYPGGVSTSEMSDAGQYFFTSCQNTDQFSTNGASCWEHFELTYEKIYNGVRAPIIKPDERTLPSGRFNLLGPNDNPASPDVNVGAKVVFPNAHGAPGMPPRRYRLFGADNVTPAGNVAVSQHITSSGREVKQGNTADDGRIYFMGATSAYTYTAAGVSRATAATGSRYSVPGDFSWSYGEGVLPAVEDDSIFLSEVQGELPLIPDLSLTATGIQYSLTPLNQFVSPPSLATHIDNQFVDSTDLVFDGNSYRTTIQDTSFAEFDFTVYATDNASSMYFFNSAVSVSDLNGPGALGRTAGMQSDFSLSLNSSVAATKKVILTTDYPPIRSGLAPAQIQSGKVGVVQVFPAVSTLSGFNSLQIRYPVGSAESDGIDSSLELTLRIHRWNKALGQWELVGGTVNTNQNEVSAEITELGTYALFTTDIQTDVEDGGTGVIVPKQFELHQNYPNPFNPTTTIAYSLPHKADVTVTIYNILGEVVRVYDEGMKSAGRHSVNWNSRNESGKSVASGVYFYKVQAGELTASRKMLLLK